MNYAPLYQQHGRLPNKARKSRFEKPNSGELASPAIYPPPRTATSRFANQSPARPGPAVHLYTLQDRKKKKERERGAGGIESGSGINLAARVFSGAPKFMYTAHMRSGGGGAWAAAKPVASLSYGRVNNIFPRSAAGAECIASEGDLLARACLAAECPSQNCRGIGVDRWPRKEPAKRGRGAPV